VCRHWWTEAAERGKARARAELERAGVEPLD
jgi:hypothetical protein